jgi:hypothetical protein
MRVKLIWRKDDKLFVRAGRLGVVFRRAFWVLAAVLLAFAGVGWHLWGPGEAGQSCLLIGGVFGGFFLLLALATSALSSRPAVMDLTHRTLKIGGETITLDDLRGVYLFSGEQRVPLQDASSPPMTETKYYVAVGIGRSASWVRTKSVEQILLDNLTQETLPSVSAQLDEKYHGLFDGQAIVLVGVIVGDGRNVGRIHDVAETIAMSLNAPLVETVNGAFELRLPGTFGKSIHERLALEPGAVEEAGPPPEGVEVHEGEDRLEIQWNANASGGLIGAVTMGGAIALGCLVGLEYVDGVLAWVLGVLCLCFVVFFSILVCCMLRRHGPQRFVLEGGCLWLHSSLPWPRRQHMPLQELRHISASLDPMPSSRGLYFYSDDRYIHCPMYPRTADWIKARVLSFLRSLSAERSEAEVGPYR